MISSCKGNVVIVVVVVGRLSVCVVLLCTELLCSKSGAGATRCVCVCV